MSIQGPNRVIFGLPFGENRPTPLRDVTTGIGEGLKARYEAPQHLPYRLLVIMMQMKELEAAETKTADTKTQAKTSEAKTTEAKRSVTLGAAAPNVTKMRPRSSSRRT